MSPSLRFFLSVLDCDPFSNSSRAEISKQICRLRSDWWKIDQKIAYASLHPTISRSTLTLSYILVNLNTPVSLPIHSVRGHLLLFGCGAVVRRTDCSDASDRFLFTLLASSPCQNSEEEIKKLYKFERVCPHLGGWLWAEKF